MAGTTHEFAAIAFEENLSLRELAPAFPGARLGVRELVVPCDGGEMFLYPFGAIVFHNVSLERREVELARREATADQPDAERSGGPGRDCHSSAYRDSAAISRPSEPHRTTSR